MLYRFFKIYYPNLVYWEDYTYLEEVEEDETDEDSHSNAGSQKITSRRHADRSIESNREDEPYTSSVLMSVRQGYQYQYRSQYQNFFVTSVEAEDEMDSALWLLPMFGEFVKKGKMVIVRLLTVN